jgi:hypothetical protein
MGIGSIEKEMSFICSREDDEKEWEGLMHTGY